MSGRKSEGLRREVDRCREKEEERLIETESQRVLNKLLRLSLERMPLERMLKLFIKNIVNIPWFSVAKKGGIFIMDEAAGDLVLRAEYNLAPEINRVCARVPLGRCLCGRAAKTGKIIFTEHIDKKHENKYPGMAPHGHYCVPVMNPGKKVLGVITLYVREGHEARDSEKRFLLAIADVIAGVLERERMFEMAVRYEKMALVGHLAAGIAHDINNPLSVIFGNLILLGPTAAKAPAALKEQLISIEKQAERIKAIVERLIYYSKGKKPRIEKVDVNAVLREVAPLLSHYPEFKSITWREELAGDLPSAKGDAGQLREVFINLCLNACQAVKQGGSVSLISRPGKKGGIEILVTDTGGGIKNEDMTRIFEPFFTTRPEGTGLGLYIVKSIIKAHDGGISVESKVGGGTTFRISLPPA